MIMKFTNRYGNSDGNCDCDCELDLGCVAFSLRNAKRQNQNLIKEQQKQQTKLK